MDQCATFVSPPTYPVRTLRVALWLVGGDLYNLLRKKPATQDQAFMHFYTVLQAIEYLQPPTTCSTSTHTNPNTASLPMASTLITT